MLKVNLPLRFFLFFGEARSRRMGAQRRKKDRKKDRLIEGYKPPGNEWLSRDESPIRFPVVMFLKITSLYLPVYSRTLVAAVHRLLFTIWINARQKTEKKSNSLPYKNEAALQGRKCFFFFTLKKVKSRRRRRKIKRFLWVIPTKRSLVTWCLVSWLGYKKPKLGHESELTLQHFNHLRHLSHVTNP